jgi:hypothetical protein
VRRQDVASPVIVPNATPVEKEILAHSGDLTGFNAY